MTCPGWPRVPTKAAYRAFLEDPGLEFEFYLAEKLGRTVEELRLSLSADEFLRWSIYYAKKAQTQQLERMRNAG